MFDWFKNIGRREYTTDVRTDMEKIADDMKKVVPFPELKSLETKMPEVNPVKPKINEAKVFYRFGLTDNNRVAFQMGLTEITMSREGCQNLIDELTFYMNRITDEVEDES